ncbi:capsid cement protein [Aeromonas hydrophila]|uniref:DUF2190 domain-containing protein n=1 Tax=Aeromonas hydrophila TaxID=644 RepID=A0ABD7G485_AERHY|nr:capsid cement protein [Aeromonas hydrophila]RCF46449.1 DUF2190 domain-containing protein [Aeromonas hydrophila]
MGNPTLIKNYTAEGDIAAYRIVKFGAADGGVAQAAASTDLVIGVNAELPVVAGERVDVVRAGLADVEFGGTVARGQPVAADANGKAVVAAPAANVSAHIIGFAEVSAVAGDIAPVLLARGVFQGAA